MIYQTSGLNDALESQKSCVFLLLLPAETLSCSSKSELVSQRVQVQWDWSEVCVSNQPLAHQCNQN